MHGLNEVPFYRNHETKFGCMGRISYHREGDAIYYTQTRSDEGAATSIIYAEQIILAVCEAEGLDWRPCVFYDLQTLLGGYDRSGRGPGYYCLDALVIAPSPHNPALPSVDGFRPVAMSHEVWEQRGEPGSILSLQCFSASLYRHFRPFIV